MSGWDYTTGTLPWTKTCFVCGEDNPNGLRLRSRVEGDRIVLSHVTRDSDLGYRHLVHGGISMTLLDEVMTSFAILRKNIPRHCKHLSTLLEGKRCCNQ